VNLKGQLLVELNPTRAVSLLFALFKSQGFPQNMNEVFLSWYLLLGKALHLTGESKHALELYFWSPHIPIHLVIFRLWFGVSEVLYDIGNYEDAA
jgi:hypothetical protein